MIETREGFIEDPSELDLIIEKIEFESILELNSETVNETSVYDLEINDVHNYILENGGIVHNGGGKL